MGLTVVEPHGLKVVVGGGWIEIDSAPGRGTRIQIYLPVAYGDGLDGTKT